MSRRFSGESPLELDDAGGQAQAGTWRVDLAVAALCILLVTEAICLAPMNADAGLYLRLARAQAAGAVPCRDIYCEYTPLVTSVLAGVRGEPVPSMAVVQLAIFACAVLTYRLARTLGYPLDLARRMSIVTWALLLANEGRSILLEPFTLVCLLGAATSFSASPGWGAALRAGLWIGLGFWTKQYALVGWVGLLTAGLLGRRLVAMAALSAGTVLGVSLGFGVLLGLGTEPVRLRSLFAAGAYPPGLVMSNLVNAPEMLGILILSYSTMTRTTLLAGAAPGVSVPFLMSAAALLPLYFRGYRHYWQLIVPFLVIQLLTLPAAPGRWTRAARRGAILLILVSVGLDVGRCVRDATTQARHRQRVEATRLTALGQGSGAALYLVDPAVLAWMDSPVVALRQVGPKFTRFSRREAETLLSAAEVVVWDTSWPGADEPMRRLSADPPGELARRGFLRTGSNGGVQVYSRKR